MCAAGARLHDAADSTGAEMVKIVQTPGLIVMLNPDLTYRQIFLDGRALESAPNPTWMGYSVGRWDGDTLVVESFGFNDRTWLDHDGHPHTEAFAHDRALPAPQLRQSRRRGDVLGPGGLHKAVDGRRSRRIGRRHRDDRMGLQRKRPRRGALGRQGVGRTEGRSSGRRRRFLRSTSAPMSSSRRSGELPPRVVEITVSNGKLLADMDGRGKVPLIAIVRDRRSPACTDSASSSSRAAPAGSS